MFSRNEILARLREGVDAQTIGNEMADELNAAVAAYNKEKAEAGQKRTKARTAVDALIDLFDLFYPNDEVISDKERDQLTDAILDVATPQEKKLTDEDVIKAFLKGLV